jgi:hypothetical protein
MFDFPLLVLTIFVSRTRLRIPVIMQATSGFR